MTPEQLEAILMRRAGALQETPYAVLLLALASYDKPAVLRLKRNQLQKEIVFDGGSPVECRSNIATETLGRFLVSQGKLSEQNSVIALSESTSRGVPLGEILVEKKLLTPTELYRVLQQNLGRKLLEPFSWKSGTYEISFDAQPASSALRVRVPQLIVTGIVKVDTQESADEAVAPAKGKFLSIASSLDDVRLTADQQKIVEAARSGVSFDEIRARSGVDPDDVNRIAAALLLLGAFKITDRPVPYMPPFQAVATPPAPVAPPPPVAQPPVAAEEVMAVFLSFRRKDPFDFFGVTEDADISAINQAYLRFAEKFRPSKFDPNAPDALHEKVQQIFLAAARGYAELAYNERRDALVKRRIKAREQAEAAAKAGQAALIDPEQLYKNGCALVEAGKLREALSNFELAAECDAQNGNYAAEAVWARFQLKLTPAGVALKRLKDALRIDPNCAVAYLYGGRLHTILGNRMEAEAYLNRAAMLLPKDMRVVEALKALK